MSGKTHCIGNIVVTTCEVDIMGETLEFYDVKSKAKFKTDKYRLVEKSGRNFAVAKATSGPHECWKILGKEAAAKLKKAA